MRRVTAVFVAGVALAALAGSAAAGRSATGAGSKTLEGVVGDLRAEETDTREALSRVMTELEQADARILARGRAYVKRARSGLMPVAGGLDALVDHASGLERLRRALKRDQDLQGRLIERRRELVRQIVEVQRRRAPLEEHQQTVAGSQAAILAEKDRSLAFDSAFSKSKKSKKLKKSAKSGASGASGKSGASGASGVYAASSGSSADGIADGDGTGSFSGRRGLLPLPVAGRARVRASKSGSGCRISARVGSPVRAVHQGRVVFAGPYRNLGKAVILDHDGGYSTLSAGLRDIRVAVGETVPPGTQLGTLAGQKSTGKLYFEVRKGEVPIASAVWFGL